MHDVSRRIRAAAVGLPEVAEGSSCVNRAFSAGKKNFAFLGEKGDQIGLRLKLGDSLDDVGRRAQDDPERYDVGMHGWTMMRFPADDPPPAGDLETWVVESYRLLVPKKISRQLDD